MTTQAPLQRRLEELVDNVRAVRSLGLLGIDTLADFLGAPREQVLNLPGVDAEFYAAIVEAIRESAVHRPIDLSLVPRSFLHCELADLELDAADAATVSGLGLHRVQDAVLHPDLVRSIGSEAHARLYGALEALVENGSRWAHGNPTMLCSDEVLAHVTAGLEDAEREIFFARLGMDGTPTPCHRIAEQRGVSVRDVEHVLYSLPARLFESAPRTLRLLRRQGLKALASSDGYLASDALAPGTILHTAARDYDDHLPMRLLALCFPHDFHLVARGVTTTPLRRLRQARPLVRALTRPVLLPISVDDVLSHLATANAEIDRGLLLHLLRARSELRVYIDPKHGDVVDCTPDPMKARLRNLLEAAAGPLPLEKLVGLYRHHHGPTTQSRVVARLRSDGKCVEVGADEWTVASRCSADLDRVRNWAADASAQIRATGRNNVFELTPSRARENDAYLVNALLRRDPTLRDLGRGEFCPRDQAVPPVVAALERALRQAMGEVPLGRFLGNYQGSHKEKVVKMLAQNRLFLFPSADRVDLLTNYPYTHRWVQTMVRVAHGLLTESNGCTTLAHITDRLRDISLAAQALTQYQLRDLLHRHSHYRVLGKELVLMPGCDIAEWIADRAVRGLRAAGFPRSVAELVREAPELAAFEGTLSEVLQRDPRIEAEGERFRCA